MVGEERKIRHRALEGGVAVGKPSGLTADQRMALAREWDQTLAEVRALPGFENFLSPPDLVELLSASLGGPVVVLNVSRWRADALVVTPEGVRAVPLPDLSLDDAHERLGRHLEALAVLETSIGSRQSAEAAEQGRDANPAAMTEAAAAARRQHSIAVVRFERVLAETCAWLWSVVVEPLVAHLKLTDAAEPPRIWWCPTGPLALLPIHAAGAGATWLADLAISSYTPTVRALVDARRPLPPAPTPAPFLLVRALQGESEVPGLLGATTDLDVFVRDTVEGVTNALPQARYVHFDCHADQDLQDPAQGGLTLSDGVLRVFDLAALPLEGEFAALAACKTAVGGTNLLDESITLSSALHYTGFRHVIGSLWILSDRAAVTAFDCVYRELTGSGRFDADDSARSLARATDTLRHAGAGIHTWAALVHIGP